MRAAIVLLLVAWCYVETECEKARVVWVGWGWQSAVGTCICRWWGNRVLMTSSLWPPQPRPSEMIELSRHPWGEEHKNAHHCLTQMCGLVRLLLPCIISPCCHSFWESGLPWQHMHKQDWVISLLPPQSLTSLGVFCQTSWLASGSRGSGLPWGNVSVSGSHFTFLTSEVLSCGFDSTPEYTTHTHILGPPLRRAEVCSSHGALCSGDIPAAPLPSELPQLHQRRMSGARRGRQKTKAKKREGALLP